MTLVNLTPHSIHIQAPGIPYFEIQPSGVVARCAENKNSVGEFDGIELVTNKFGEVYDLPNPIGGTMFIVSMVVRQAMPFRKDLVSPGDLVRDESGKIIGCKNLVVNL